MPDTQATVHIFIDPGEEPQPPRLIKHDHGSVSVMINGPGIVGGCVYLSGRIGDLIAHLTAVTEVLVHEQEKRAEAEAVLA